MHTTTWQVWAAYGETRCREPPRRVNIAAESRQKPGKDVIAEEKEVEATFVMSITLAGRHPSGAECSAPATADSALTLILSCHPLKRTRTTPATRRNSKCSEPAMCVCARKVRPRVYTPRAGLECVRCSCAPSPLAILTVRCESHTPSPRVQAIQYVWNP